MTSRITDDPNSTKQYIYENNRKSRPLEIIYTVIDSIKKLEKEIIFLNSTKQTLMKTKQQYERDIETIKTYQQKVLKEMQKSKSTEYDKLENEQYNYPKIEKKILLPKKEDQFVTVDDKKIQPNKLDEKNEINQFQRKEDSSVYYVIESQNTKFTQKSVFIRFFLNTNAVICAVDFDPSGKFFAFADTRTIHIASSTNGQILISCDINYQVNRATVHTRCIKYSKDGQIIAVGIAPSSIGIFSVSQRKFIKILEENMHDVTSLLFSSDMRYLLSTCIDGSLYIWETRSFFLIKKILFSPVSQIGYNKDDSIIGICPILNGQFYAIGLINGIIRIFDQRFDVNIYYFKAHESLLYSMTVTRNGEIVTGSLKGEIKVWVPTNTTAYCRLCISAHDDIVTSLCSSYNENILISGSKDEKIKVWSLETGQNLFVAKMHTNTVLSLAHHPNGGMFLSSSGDGLIVAWGYPGISI